MQDKTSINASLTTATFFLVVALSGCMFSGDTEELQAYFNFTPSNPKVGEQVHFTAYADESFGIVSWHWDFGDEDVLQEMEERGEYDGYCVPGTESSSSVQNPKHAYCQDGTYTVTLTIGNKTGGEVTRSKTVTVTGGIEDPEPSDTGFVMPPQDSEGRYVIEMTDDMRFVPEKAEVPAGSTVLWKHSGGSHNANPDDGAWTKGEIGEDYELFVTEDLVGEHSYHCDLHVSQGMTGVLRVV